VGSPTSPSKTTLTTATEEPQSPVPETQTTAATDISISVKGKEKEEESLQKFRGIPTDVQLFEVFWKQVVELIKVGIFFPLRMSFSNIVRQARPDLSIQDITALLVSLTNLSLSCYPDRLEYVDQVLAFAAERIKDFGEKYVLSLSASILSGSANCP